MLFPDAGRALTRAREKLGLTQERLAGLLDDVTQATISRWEAGTMRPTPVHIVITARLFEFDLTEWMDAWLTKEERDYVKDVLKRRSQF
ncbi:MAG: helix-turn-helix transcriptional regulator [Polyangiaceae bacterium]|nr:helix-turn-helix transcriptional regulator [Polyangiaceae bacterium]